MAESIEVFISCAREDEDLRNQILTHLRILERNDIMTLRFQTKIDRLVRCKMRHAEKDTQAV
jgi:hypothetical protein